MTSTASRELGEANLRELLRKACKDVGSQQQWAEANGFSAPFVSDVLRGKRAITDRIASVLGFECAGKTYKRKM
jgi:hypothetical protein